MLAIEPTNCRGLPSTLLESTLFGHKRGAFSGAIADQPGFFQAASDGTLLLDEVGDMSAAVQSTLLRALQDDEVLPVGSTQRVHLDVRVVAATHRDLEAGVADGAFREDPLARLSGFTFRLPPLRERREDIGLFVGLMLRGLSTSSGVVPSLTAEAGTALVRYSWPRNLRELEKCLVRAAALSENGCIQLQHLPDEVRGLEKSPATSSAGRSLEPTSAMIQRCLDAHNGILEDTWRALGLSSRHALAGLIRRHGVEIRRRTGD